MQLYFKSTSSWPREDGVDFGRSMVPRRAPCGSMKAPHNAASTQTQCMKCLEFGGKVLMAVSITE